MVVLIVWIIEKIFFDLTLFESKKSLMVIATIALMFGILIIFIFVTAANFNIKPMMKIPLIACFVITQILLIL